uniref:SID1 transmembrane family, member 2 n=1 Tax=Cyprinodon variegatus TaxID=28743 RepID=A0A3Q2D482_CYPVA
IFLLFLPFSVCHSLNMVKFVVQKEAEFDMTYNDTVTSVNQTIYSFNHTISRNKTEGVRVTVDVMQQHLESPILFVVRQKQAVMSFQLPLILRGLPLSLFNSTLFIKPRKTTTGAPMCSTYQVNSFTRPPSHYSLFSPQFFKYVFPEGVDTVIVKVNSDVNFPCSVMSVQDIQCPVYDLDNNVAFIGMYQTMTKKGAITVQKKDFPSNSFYVVVVVKTEDEACGGPLRFYPLRPDELIDAGNRTKDLDVVVSPAIDSEKYWMGVLFCSGIFLSFYVLTLLVTCSLLPPSERSLDSIARSRQESLSSVEEDDYDTLDDIDSDKNIVRTKKYLCVADLARKDKRVLSKKYQIYFWNIATIAVFYALPVIQLVITYQTVVNVTGNQDICYYNFLCAHPLGALSAFNNILSNLGYVLLGLLFLFIVLKRDVAHKRALDRNNLNALVRPCSTEGAMLADALSYMILWCPAPHLQWTHVHRE